MNHTPGPWEWVPGTCYIWAKDAYKPKIGEHMMVAMANDFEWGDAPAPEGKMTVATARGWGRLQHLGKGRAEKIQDANARLIAAAPELARCLEAILKITCGSCEGGDGRCVTADGFDACLLAREAKAVLAKAKGESQ